jgi:hypothetical protein
MVHDGLISENETEVVMLTRSAWAGMQRWGAALWSGDTLSAFSTLKTSIQAGLNTQMSGMQKLLFLCTRVPIGRKVKQCSWRVLFSVSLKIVD